MEKLSVHYIRELFLLLISCGVWKYSFCDRTPSFRSEIIPSRRGVSTIYNLFFFFAPAQMDPLVLLEHHQQRLCRRRMFAFSFEFGKWWNIQWISIATKSPNFIPLLLTLHGGVVWPLSHNPKRYTTTLVMYCVLAGWLAQYHCGD